MFDSSFLRAVLHFHLLSAVIVAAACFALLKGLRHVFRDIQHAPEDQTFTPAGSWDEAEKKLGTTEPPYPADFFPGHRQVKTAFGKIQVFEWGPAEGEKVLLVHGLSTPCIALSNMANEFVNNGYRVMVFDLFGRGYSDAPNDLRYDARLYIAQLLLVLSSSTLPWTGSNAFHLVGFSLGGSIAVAFAARQSRWIYSLRLLPEWLRLRLLRANLEPRIGTPSADVPDEDHADIGFDDVFISADRPYVRIGDVIKWQLEQNPGFVSAYLSTIRSALVYRRHDLMWSLLEEQLASRRLGQNAPPGLPGGRFSLILAERDAIIVKEEFLDDMQSVIGPQAADIVVMKGGHEVAVSRGKYVASVAIRSWQMRSS
ncbi:Alpha/Beta hydrolase protein [Diplogelasinospora grovesii]|uniref:Alpha/Beta hydrolase protein n=1 Tax=Diplogelasinospora grovesii TaxID=303347 RepID=A0AAN6MXV4_9PEZI|nr:Alpha/Beta hydrolase protein [Diplogelasinospora grovesii]